MREREYLQGQHFNCLLDDGVVNQSIPIVLAISTEDKEKLQSKNKKKILHKLNIKLRVGSIFQDRTVHIMGWLSQRKQIPKHLCGFFTMTIAAPNMGCYNISEHSKLQVEHKAYISSDKFIFPSLNLILLKKRPD